MTTASTRAEPGRETESRLVYRPRVDIIDKPDAVLLLADLPGVGEEDVELTIEEDTLTLRASTSAASEGVNERRVHTEFTAGEFERSFSLSREIDYTGIEATVKQGVLEVVLPKSKQSLSRKIAVKTG